MEQAVGGREQALAQQHRQCGEHAAAGDRVGGLDELRWGLGQQAGSGERAAFHVARRAAHGRVLVAGIAAGAVSGDRRVADRGGADWVISGGGRRRNLGAGGGLPCAICDDAGAAVLVEGAHRDAELASAG